MKLKRRIKIIIKERRMPEFVEILSLEPVILKKKGDLNISSSYSIFWKRRIKLVLHIFFYKNFFKFNF